MARSSLAAKLFMRGPQLLLPGPPSSGTRGALALAPRWAVCSAAFGSSSSSQAAGGGKRKQPSPLGSKQPLPAAPAPGGPGEGSRPVAARAATMPPGERLVRFCGGTRRREAPPNCFESGDWPAHSTVLSQCLLRDSRSRQPRSSCELIATPSSSMHLCAQHMLGMPLCLERVGWKFHNCTPLHSHTAPAPDQHGHQRGGPGVLPVLRHVRHRRPRPAGRPRRPQTRPPAHPLRHARPRAEAEQTLQEERPRRRRGPR